MYEYIRIFVYSCMSAYTVLHNIVPTTHINSRSNTAFAIASRPLIDCAGVSLVTNFSSLGDTNVRSMHVFSVYVQCMFSVCLVYV